jgi:hypothetical protein
MSALSIQVPFPVFQDRDGQPLDNGYIWIGQANLNPQTNPIIAYYDAALTIPAVQPLRTINGYVSNAGTPAKIYVNGVNFSILVQDSKGSMVYSFPDGTGIDASLDACGIDYTPQFTGSVTYPVCEKLEEIVSLKDFGAVGDGIADDTVAWNNFIAADGLKLVNPGEYLVNGVVKSYVSGVYLHQNVNNYAVIGPNLLPGFASLAKTNFSGTGDHTAGTVGTITGNVTGNPYGYYQLKIIVNTTASGNISILQSGNTIFGDAPYYPFSTAPVLNNALEQNAIVTTNEYYFYVATASVGFSNISIATDTDWAGSITAIELYEVTPTEFSFAGTGSETDGINNPVGLKVGALNRNDMAVGNLYTLGMKEFDLSVTFPGAQNTAMGSYALATNWKGDQNTAVGMLALAYNEGSNNVGIGYSALKLNTKGQENTSIGYKSGVLNTTGYRNTFVGFWSGAYNQTGINNTRVGWQPNIAGGIVNGDTSMGAPAGTGVLNGSANCFFGSGSGVTVSGQSTLTLEGASAFGYNSKPWGDYATCVGFGAIVGTESVFADQSISIGYNAITTSTGCITIGASINNTADQSTAIGYQVVSTGQQGVSLGHLAQSIGLRNTALGAQSGVGFAGERNTFVGGVAGVQTVTYENCTLLGHATVVTGSNQVQLGDSTTTTYAYGAVQNRSDIRDKTDIRDTQLGLDFINKLRPVDYKWDYRDAYREIDENGNVINLPKDGSKKRNRYHHGLIAQEVKEIADMLGLDFGGYQDHSIEGGNDVLSIGYIELIAPMIKAIQQLSAEISELKTKIS